MYPFVLVTHSYLRWIYLALAVAVLARALMGTSGRRPWTPIDRRLNLGLLISADLQATLGFLLYVVLSPITQAGFAQIGAAMREKQLRFFLIEHPLLMIAALALLHVGNVRIKKADATAVKFKHSLVFNGLALVLTLLAIPWFRLSAP